MGLSAATAAECRRFGPSDRTAHTPLSARCRRWATGERNCGSGWFSYRLPRDILVPFEQPSIVLNPLIRSTMRAAAALVQQTRKHPLTPKQRLGQLRRDCIARIPESRRCGCVSAISRRLPGCFSRGRGARNILDLHGRRKPRPNGQRPTIPALAKAAPANPFASTIQTAPGHNQVGDFPRFAQLKHRPGRRVTVVLRRNQRCAGTEKQPDALSSQPQQTFHRQGLSGICKQRGPITRVWGVGVRQPRPPPKMTVAIT